MERERRNKLLAVCFLVLLINTAYIAAFASPTIFYMGNVLLHLGLGVALSIVAVWAITKDLELRRGVAIALPLLALAVLAAAYLVIAGNLREHQWALLAHVIAGGLGVVALAPYAWKQPLFRKPFAIALMILVMLPVGTSLARRAFPAPNDRIRNPHVVPASPNEEGGGPKSPFFPSSAKTNTGGIIPSNFFMDSERCGECHKDIYRQWNSSVQ